MRECILQLVDIVFKRRRYFWILSGNQTKDRFAIVIASQDLEFPMLSKLDKGFIIRISDVLQNSHDPRFQSDLNATIFQGNDFTVQDIGQ